MARPPLWQEQARAIGGEHFVTLIEGMNDTQNTLARQLKEVADAQEDIRLDLNALKSAMADIVATAFPAGDTDGHRRYHELIIQKTEEVRKLRVAIQEKTISALIWSFLVFIGVCVWTFVANTLKGHSP